MHNASETVKQEYLFVYSIYYWKFILNEGWNNKLIMLLAINYINDK